MAYNMCVSQTQTSLIRSLKFVNKHMVYFRLTNLMREYWNTGSTCSSTEAVCRRMSWKILNKAGNVRVTRSYNHCCRGKTVSITPSECVSVACPTVQYFSTLSEKRHDFKKEVVEQVF